MTKRIQGHSVDLLSNYQGFRMQKQRRNTWLANTVATGFAALLLAVDLMVRDPQPHAAAMTKGDGALLITMIFMALGLCVVAYGLYHERHKLLAHARQRLELRLRFARRGAFYPSPRRITRLQRAWSQA
jgi:hypothetical protein